VFLKPTSSLLKNNGTVIIPATSSQVHHEVELVIAISKACRNVSREDALNYIAGYAVGIDVTDRDMQSELKKKAYPWVLAKGLDTFAPLGRFVTPSAIQDPRNVELLLSVNGVVKQSGNTKNMLFPIDDIISRLSTFFTLQEGDLIYTGTPEGVGPLVDGDQVTASIANGLSELNINIKQG
jgi:2-keto-4-pentenoate hydratase/2-oxohepta-3-ene-1,7-dioic acid hydratase in catechol pathway